LKVHNIPLESFITKGKVALSVDDGELHITANTDFHRIFYAYIEGKYKLPFRIDMTVKIDSPSLYILIGKGYINIGKPNHRGVSDIFGSHSKKPNTHDFDNYIPLNEYVNISVIYGRKALCLIINDKQKFYSKKEPYIKALKTNTIPEEFIDGFTFALSCDKRTILSLKSVSVIEYENDELDVLEEIDEKKNEPLVSDETGKLTIEKYIKDVSPELQHEILQTDKFLMNDMKESFQFKRKMENKIFYVSSGLISCQINVFKSYVWFGLSWIGTNKNEQGICGESSRPIRVLNKLAETSPEFADKMFFRMTECTNCRSGTGGRGCPHNGQVYEYNGKKKVSCGGSFQFKMIPSDFEDLRKMITAISEVANISYKDQ
jgi:hypothetical protein